MIDNLYFVIGIGFGIIVITIIMIVAIIIGTLENDKRLKKEVRKAHDEGYAHGRRWHDKEIEWAEIEIEYIKNALRKIGRRE